MRWHVRVPGDEAVAVIDAMQPIINEMGATFYRLVPGPLIGGVHNELVAHFKTWVSILKDEAEDGL
jgi:hypothetical protein